MSTSTELRAANPARSSTAFALSALAWASCAVPGAVATDGTAHERSDDRSAKGSPVVHFDVDAAPTEPASIVDDAAPWADVDLALWSDPAFRKRFTESYVAETDIEPRMTDKERSRLLEIVELIGEEKVDKAMSQLQDEIEPGASAVFDFMLANIHFQREELTSASVSYRNAVTKYPKFRRAWKNLALVHVRRDEFAQAASAFARVIELGGGDSVTYGLLGVTCSNLEQHMAAESAFRLAVMLDPVTSDWSTGLARSFFKQKRFAEAVTVCGNLIEKDPNRADLWLLQANAFIGLGQPLRAAENFEVVDKLGAANFETLTTLGDIYVNERLYDLGVKTYLRGLELQPNGDVTRILRATKLLTAQGAQVECEQLIAGIESLVGATLSDADRKEILKVRVRIATASGAGEEEARALEEIVALDPLDGEALILLGQHCGRTGETERAAFYFERAAGLEAFEADAKVRHAQMLVNLQRYGEAVPLLARAQAIRPRENIQQYLEQVERAAQAR